MFRKTSGAILCPTCGRLTNANAPACLVCGRRRPGMWGFAGPLRTLFSKRGVVDVITVACAVLFVTSLLIDPFAAVPRGGFDPFGIFSPSPAALIALGATSPYALWQGQWWTHVTAIYLHGGLLHILFNMLSLRQLAPAVEETYGTARLIVIFTVAGAAGFLASNLLGQPLTIGASGSIFGLLGAMVAFGRQRGGTLGKLILREYGHWALVLFIMGFFMPAINNVAHAGGFLGGYLTAAIVPLAERRAESGFDHLLAAGAGGVTILGFALAVWSAFG